MAADGNLRRAASLLAEGKLMEVSNTFMSQVIT